MKLLLKSGEWLYKNAYFIYEPLYFFYKKKNESFEINLIKNIIKKNDTVIDIGANIGFYTKLFAHIVGPQGRVYAFEPDPKNFHHLKKNTQSLKNVIIENKAISAYSGKIKLYHSELNVDHRVYPNKNCTNYQEIECTSIDDYFSNFNMPEIHLIKIDIQGYEPYAIKGAIDTIKNNKSLKLITEFWPYGLNEVGSSAIEYFNLLQNYFNKIYLINTNELNELNLSNIQQLSAQPEHYYNIFAEK